MKAYEPVRLARDLERRLGDPYDATRTFSFARCAQLDDDETFPADICAELDDLGVHRYYVPGRYGGAMTSREEPLALVRVLARRDLATAVAYSGKTLGAESVWVAGRPEQAARVAGEVLSGVRVALGLTERGHGGDLLATETSAVRDGEGYRLDGEKWLINGAARGELMCLLARTESAGGPAGMSMLLVDKRTLADGAYECLPKVATHGLRAIDVSGIRFRGAKLPAGALVGRPGTGLDVVLKALQLSRIGCAALSLGAADQAIDIVTRFAAKQDRQDRQDRPVRPDRHPVDGRRLLDVPSVRRLLGSAYARLFIAEVVGLVAGRGVHTLTGEMSVVSAVVKSFVPTLVEECVADLGELLGRHAFVMDDATTGRFQKVERDHRIVGIFDGSTFANRAALVNQFERLARSYRRGVVDEAGVAGTVRLGGGVAPVDPSRLSIISRTGCSLVQGLPDATRRVEEMSHSGRIPATAGAMAAMLRAATDELHDGLAGRWAQRDLAPEAFDLAERYEAAFAAAACLSVWLHNHRRIRAGAALVPWADGRWLIACLGLLLRRLYRDPPAADRALDDLYELVAAEPHAATVSVLPHRFEAGGHVD